MVDYKTTDQANVSQNINNYIKALKRIAMPLHTTALY